MRTRSATKILLTGAGFTHNFGTPLAEQLWSTIFSHSAVQGSERVRTALLENLDFEGVYAAIMEGAYDQAEKDTINTAVRDAFDDIDRTLIDWTFTARAPCPVNIYKVQKMIDAFSGTAEESGFLFTLNQDLFLERHYCNGERPLLPGLANKQRWFTSVYREPLRSDGYCRLPSQSQLASGSADFQRRKLLYVKLHGSCNWVSAIRDRQMVLGHGKRTQIEEEPLLAWYFELFEKVLQQPDRRLLVVGYGFGDDHINEVIADAVTNYGLKVYVISPSSHRTYADVLPERHRGPEIWSGLGGYFQYRLVELFPPDQSESSGWRQVQSQFFERTIR